MEKEPGPRREILPSQGIWSVEDLAVYLDLPSAAVQQKLVDSGVRVIQFSSRYKHKLFRLEDFGNRTMDWIDETRKQR